jgi:poly(3-hydroxybutyrate) depolymerase
MLYDMYQAQADTLEPLRAWARRSAALWRSVTPPAPYGIAARHMNAALDVFGYSGTTHKRPDYRIGDVMVGNHLVPVTTEIVHATPFGSLLHFTKDTDRAQPKVLLVAPMSGHFATLLRNTVAVLLQDHDVYITDARRTGGGRAFRVRRVCHAHHRISGRAGAALPCGGGVPADRCGAGGGLADVGG